MQYIYQKTRKTYMRNSYNISGMHVFCIYVYLTEILSIERS